MARKFDIKRKAYVAEIPIDDLLSLANLKKTFAALPKYPSVKRDIAILVDDAISASNIYSVIKEEARGLVKSVDVFDLYKGHLNNDGLPFLLFVASHPPQALVDLWRVSCRLLRDTMGGR